MVDSEGAPRILVLGDSSVGKHALLGAIREEADVQRGQAAYPWRLDTKYYTADVQFEVRHVEGCAGVQLEETGYEAVVLVFHAGRRSSFDKVQQWYEAAGGGDANLGVKLAVGMGGGSSSGDSSAAKPGWLQEAEEWCAEQLVEYVEAEDVVAMAAAAASSGQSATADEAAAEATQAVASGATAARSDQDATGVARVREALAAHMWPGMQLKPNPRRGAGAGAAAAAPAAAAATQRAQHGRASEAVEDAVPAAGSPMQAANGLHASSSSGNGLPAREGAADFSFGDYLQAPEDAMAGAAAGSRIGGSSSGGGEEEAEVEQLEQLFAQLSGHRDRLAQLPDTQRREAAAAMVMQLMAAMGLDEEEEQDAEDEEDE